MYDTPKHLKTRILLVYDSFIVFGCFVTKSLESLEAIEFRANVHLFKDFENFEKSNEFSGVSPIGVPCFLLAPLLRMVSQTCLMRYPVAIPLV